MKLDSKIFDANLQALRQHRPALAAQIEPVEIDPQRYRLVETQSGRPNLEIHASTSPVCFYSQYGPQRECERQIETLPADCVFSPVLLGIGLGYRLRHLYDKRRDHFFDCALVEHDPAVFRLAMQVTPLHDLFSDSRFQIQLGESWDDWNATVHTLTPGVMSSRLQVLPHPPSQSLAPKFYQQAVALLEARVQLAHAEFHLMINSGGRIQENLWGNLLPSINAAGVNQLADCLKGKPAIIVAAGPSLDRNVHHLADAQSRCIIICVDTALRTLRANNIAPHIVVSNDPTELNVHHFEGVEFARDTILAYDPELYAPITRSWPGRRLLMNLEKSAFTRWMERAVAPFGYVPKGVSVGNAAFFLARALGAGPIVFVGLDLAFDPKGGRTHTQGSALHREHQEIQPGSTNAQLGPRSESNAMQEKIVWVDGVHGEPVPTSQIMSMYLRQFVEEIAHTDARVIDATEGGALIAGTELHTLKEALDDIEPQGNPAQWIAFTQPKCDIARLQHDLSEISKALESAMQVAKQGLRLCDLLAPQLSQGAEIRKTQEWQQMEDGFNALHQNEAIKVALEQAMFGALYQFIQKELSHQVELRLNKYRQYFAAFLQIAPQFPPIIRETASYLEK
ncbi:MAG: DUF115 domain-containing protein [Candidatus Hinthialibacter antarcticus]|nr:DUF115 domain-containing protein [Candidatus Hinthialibacter antarcticus]